MKKIILSIGFIVCALFVIHAQSTATSTNTTQKPNAPKFKFIAENIDFGAIEQNSNGDVEYKFTNVGKEPLIISRVTASSGCEITWSPDPVMPGQSAVIKVHQTTVYDGKIEKMVTIYSNADTPVKSLYFEGVIKGK